MTKLLGAVLIIVSGTAMGISKYLSLRRGVNTLYDLIAALETMRGEICTRLTPLPELTDILSRRGGDGVRKMFESVRRGLDGLSENSFSVIWDESLKELAGICPDDLYALSSLGAALGRYDAKEQEVIITRVIGQLSASAQRAGEGLRSAGKLYIGLGAGLCAMAAAVLI
jgi:stage III sporulation protein AB